MALGVEASYSPSGWLMLVASAIVIVGVITAPWRRVGRGGIVRAGLGLLALVVIGRIVVTSFGDTTMLTLPGGGSRWLGHVVDEQDGSLVGARALLMTWPLAPAERTQLLPAMHDAFVAMRRSEGTTPSPAVDTLLGRQRSDAFDALVIEPHGREPKGAVVFLHGYAGSFTLECWMIAEAARTIDAVTVCPSTGFVGKWATHDGEQTLLETLAYVARRDLSRVYLAGLSNGAMGASMLAPRLAHSLSGLILIAGVSPEGDTGGVPTLVVQGESDGNVSAPLARAFATRVGATYASFDGGHFVMMVRRIEVRDTIAAWLQGRAAGP